MRMMMRCASMLGMSLIAIAALGARCIENTDMYTGRDGLIHVSGEMVNETDVSASTVTLQATLFDSQDRVVAQATGRLCPETVQPNSQNVFDIRFETPGLISAVRHDVRPIAGTTIAAQLPDASVEILGFDARKFFNVTVRGDIRNNSPNTYSNMSVCVAFYDASGSVIHVLSAPVAGTVGPGADFHWGFADSGYSGNDAVAAALWFVPEPGRAWVFSLKTALITLP